MEEAVQVVLELELGEDLQSFDLEKAVCNHGFFMMSPNVWDVSTRTLRRPLRLADAAKSVDVAISHAPDHRPNSLLIAVSNNYCPEIIILSADDKQTIIDQVSRMLRISSKDERDVRAFWKLHDSAMEKGFGRIFRSPSLFEDFVKSLLLCATSFGRSLKMVKLLCDLQADLRDGLIALEHFEPKDTKCTKTRTRKRSWSKLMTTKGSKPSSKSTTNNNYTLRMEAVKLSGQQRSSRSSGNFPTASELAVLKEEFLKERCNLGYRAKGISNLAKMIAKGDLELQELEQQTAVSCEEAYARIISIPYIGEFVCSNMLMCMGYYHTIPVDTETFRHIRKRYSRKDCGKQTIKHDLEDIYGKFRPFQCLAYWSELLEEYEEKLGKLSELEISEYSKASSSCFRIQL